MVFFLKNEQYAKVKQESKKKRPGKIKVSFLHDAQCSACPLNQVKENKHPQMPPCGNTAPVAYMLGMGPGEQEDRHGEPFIGPAGALLKSQVTKSRVRYNNVVRTRPPNNREPTWVEMECCRPSIIKDIENTKPKALCLFGNPALWWGCGETGIQMWRGRKFPIKVGSHVCWAYPIVHPAAILRRGKLKRWRTMEDVSHTFDKPDLWEIHPLNDTDDGRLFCRDIGRVFSDLDAGLGDPPLEDTSKLRDNIECISCTDDGLAKVIKYLNSLCDSEEPVGLDIETNALRPYGPGARILSIAVGRYDYTIAWPMEHSQATWSRVQLRQLWDVLAQFLRTSKCIKVAHNLAFELEWLGYFIGMDIVRATPWADTMQQAYTLDERRSGGMLSLDMLCMQYFGFKLKDYSNVNVGNLDAERLEDVLLYNGMDAKYTEWLYPWQSARLEAEGLEGIYEEQLRRVPTMVLTQLLGVNTDQKRANEIKDWLESKISTIETEVVDLEVVKTFERNERHPFNPLSSADVIKIFRDYLQRMEGKISGSLHDDKYSTKDEVLQKIDHPLAQHVLDLRRYKTKLLSTYCLPLILPDGEDVYPDGTVHTSLNTTFTRTGRLSSDSPNLQNQPKHKDKWIRSMYVPPKGCLFVAIDYKQLEACVIAMFSGDRTLIEAIKTGYDIHMDWSYRIAKRYPPIVGGEKNIEDIGVMTKLRNDEVKANWVFASFYGAQAITNAGRLKIPPEIADDLMEEFWDMFPDVRRWQERLVRQYNRLGYVECLTGRRRHAPISHNKIINTPVQGTAADIVVDAMNRLSEHAQETGEWEYQARLNIHDDLTFAFPEERAESCIEFAAHQMVNPPYSWADPVPLTVSVEAGYNWADMEEIAKYTKEAA